MIKRVLGIIVALIGALGIVLSLLGAMYVWRAAQIAEAAADDALGLLSDTLDNVEDSLDVALTTLDDAADAMDALHATTLEVGETLSSTQPTLQGMADLAEDDLSQSIESTLAALQAMEETAGVVDRMMRGLSLFGVGDYDPDVPLDQAVATMGAGLEPVPGDLRQMGNDLRQAGSSLEGVQDSITRMGDHILDIGKDVSSANAVIGSYTEIVRRLQARMRALRENIGQSIRAVAWGATLLLIWIGLSQLALIQWGIGLWSRGTGDEQTEYREE
jgi:methyl-accepting chemotaxis protein